MATIYFNVWSWLFHFVAFIKKNQLFIQICNENQKWILRCSFLLVLPDLSESRICHV